MELPMSWNKTDKAQEQRLFIDDWFKKELTFSDLCQYYKISRKTGYKLVNRFKHEGGLAFEELSRTRHHHPNETPEAVKASLLAMKARYPHWGPVTIKHKLAVNEPKVHWPAASTIGEIFKKYGLTKPRKYRRKVPPYTQPFKQCDAPNRVWSADFKGEFRLGMGQYCYPLTITDNYSRYLLACDGMEGIHTMPAKRCFERVFIENGLPEVIRTDNGTPFCSPGIGGLSALSVWFLKLGIMPERIEAGHPEQNGRHERMHRTLKEATTTPVLATMRQQQKRFDDFKQEYNDERPHQGIDMMTPSKLYQKSTRCYPSKLDEVCYPDEYIIRKVRHNGEIKWFGKKYYVSITLTGEPVGMKMIDEGQAIIYFCGLYLGIIDKKLDRIKRPGK